MRPEALDDYGRKRDFGRTPEPPPERRERGGPLVFVVHRHDARRLHWDLRLEHAGVLLSWAVPKGFTYDRREKHLAVRTENHPIEYEHFSGVIPKGEYGAGTMTIWDKGTFRFLGGKEPDEQLAQGEVKVLLYGRRLRGEWHLVETKPKERHWLLFKSRDRYEGPARDSVLGADLATAPLADAPADLTPMTPGASSVAFDAPDWLFEMEFVGRRTLVAADEDGARALDGAALPEGIARELAALRAGRAVLDGVLVATDEGGRPSRAALDAKLAEGDEDGVALYVFDLLFFEDYDLRGLELIERKAGLRSLLPADATRVLFVDHVLARGTRLFEAVQQAGLPGLVAKRAASAYTSGPSEDWRAVASQEGASEGGGPAERLDEALERRKARAPRVKLTNPGKVYWPREGLTKGDLLGYYEAVGEVLLPYLHDRPIHMNRWPDGIEGKSFYQRQAKEHTPDWVETVDVRTYGSQESYLHMLCNDFDTLLYLVNLGSIDLHPWMSRRGSLESPDYSIIDLDPKQAPFQWVVRIARECGKLLRGIGIEAQLKTSGKTGLHVYVPLRPGYDWEQSRMFAEAIARIVARGLPDIATVERSIGEREGKVYVDFGQNRQGQTVVPPYSARPVPGATVSTPLEWDELADELSPAMFTILNVPARLEERGDLFRRALAALDGGGVDLAAALGRLEEYLREA